ncbi:MAG: hypothetical protein R3E01_05255 [Pirellulaceae bacterium]|nr:hypothetical protein [Planctomycetales bacterium]
MRRAYTSTVPSLGGLAITLWSVMAVVSPTIAVAEEDGAPSATTRPAEHAVAGVDGAERSGAEATEWLVGDEFHQRLDATASLVWQDTTLRDGLERLAAAHHIAIFLDRRVDPTQTLTLNVSDLPLRKLLQRIAVQTQIGIGFVGPVVYFGPPAIAARVATLAEIKNQQAKRLPVPVQARFLEAKPCSWTSTSEPRRLISALVKQHRARFTTLDVVPHDLWKANNLPAMTLPEKLTLILAGFNKSYDVSADGSVLSLTGFPESVSLERVYRAPNNAQVVADQLTALLPQAEVRVDGGRVVVRSTLEDHWAISRLNQRNRGASGNEPETVMNSHGDSRPRVRSQRAEKRYSLVVEQQPVGHVVDTLAKQLGITVEWVGIEDESKRQRVSFQVTDATLEELLQAAVGPAAMQAKVAADKVTVLARP